MQTYLRPAYHPKPPSTKPDLPWKLRILTSLLNLLINASRRSNGTVNRRLFNFFDRNLPSSPNLVDGVKTSDVTVDSTTLHKLPNKTLTTLRKPPDKTLTTLRRFATTLAAKPFPDEPTAAYYDELAFAAGDSRDFHALRDVLNKRVQDGFLNSRITFSFLKDTNFSPSLIDSLIQTLSQLNQGSTRRSALDSLVTRLCKLRHADEALRVIDSLARDNVCAPAACTFYPVLKYFTREEKSLDHARRVVDHMVRLGIAPDLTTHNIFLMAHCYAGELDSAAGVLKRMEEDGVAADARTFDALVLGACRAGKVEGAMLVVRRMVDDGVPMLYSTHMCIIGTLLKMKCYELAMKYVRVFVGKDKLLDSELLGCLASKLVNLKRVNEAMSILEEMKQKGVPMGHKLNKFYEMMD